MGQGGYGEREGLLGEGGGGRTCRARAEGMSRRIENMVLPGNRVLRWAGVGVSVPRSCYDREATFRVPRADRVLSMPC